MSSTFRSLVAGLFIDDGTTEVLIGREVEYEPKDSDNYLPFTISDRITIPVNGSYTFVFKFGRRGIPGAVATVSLTELDIVRVDNG